MFELKAGTQIQVFAPFGKVNSKSTVVENGIAYTDNYPWKPMLAKQTTLHEKEDVFDAVALHNGREMPMWVARNIELGKTVIRSGSYWAMVEPKALLYID